MIGCVTLSGQRIPVCGFKPYSYDAATNRGVPEVGQWGRMMKRVVEIAEVLVGVPVLLVLIAAGMLVTIFRDTSVG